MTVYTVSSGQTESYSLLPQDTLKILNSGTEVYRVFEGGTIYVSSGGVENSDIFTNGATETGNRSDFGSIITDLATMYIGSVGIGLSAGPGGTVVVVGNDVAPTTTAGVVTDTTGYSGGLLKVAVEGLSQDTSLSGGQLVVNFGSATGTLIYRQSRRHHRDRSGQAAGVRAGAHRRAAVHRGDGQLWCGRRPLGHHRRVRANATGADDRRHVGTLGAREQRQLTPHLPRWERQVSGRMLMAAMGASRSSRRTDRGAEERTFRAG
jgi:hypothetical protein